MSGRNWRKCETWRGKRMLVMTAVLLWSSLVNARFASTNDGGHDVKSNHEDFEDLETHEASQCAPLRSGPLHHPPYDFGAEHDLPLWLLYFGFVLTTVLLLLVLLQKRMRTPVLTLVYAKALTDFASTVLYLGWPVVTGFVEYLFYPWCLSAMCFYQSLPVLLHTISIWLTVDLAFHRFISVHRPFEARTRCTMEKTVRGIFLVLLMAGLTWCYRFVALSILGGAFRFHQPTDYLLPEDIPVPNNTAIGWDMMWGNGRTTDQWGVFMYNLTCCLFRLIFISFLPCLMLCLMTSLLRDALRWTKRRRMDLLAIKFDIEAKRVQESEGITLTVVCIVGFTLLLEVPGCVLYTLMALQYTFNLHIFSMASMPPVWALLNFSCAFLNPLNLLVCCVLNPTRFETPRLIFGPRSAGSYSYKPLEEERDGKKPKGLDVPVRGDFQREM